MGKEALPLLGPRAPAPMGFRFGIGKHLNCPSFPFSPKSVPWTRIWLICFEESQGASLRRRGGTTRVTPSLLLLCSPQPHFYTESCPQATVGPLASAGRQVGRWLWVGVQSRSSLWQAEGGWDPSLPHDSGDASACLSGTW